MPLNVDLEGPFSSPRHTISTNNTLHSSDSCPSQASDNRAPSHYPQSSPTSSFRASANRRPIPRLAQKPEEASIASICGETSMLSESTSSMIYDPSFEIKFTSKDPSDPKNWPLWYRSIILGFASYATWVVVLYSTSYTTSMPGMMSELNVSSELIATLGVTVYLLGQATGSLVLAPLSELCGRRPVYLCSLAVFCVMVIPASTAENSNTILVVRFLSAFAGSAMISNSPGTVSDITNENHRALAFSIWSVGPMNGLVTGPLIGGFLAEYCGWRWNSWLVLIFGTIAFLYCLGIKETYAPIILQKKAATMRKKSGDDRWWSRYDRKVSKLELVKSSLSRPLVLAFTEPILWVWTIYISLINATLYLCFVAYPFIFRGLRHWSLGQTGLSFLGMGVGNMLTILSEPLLRRLINTHPPDPLTGRRAPEASVSVVCIASILCPVGQFWFAWTSMPTNIHCIWPILAGIPYGAGNCLVFIYASNYLATTYGDFAASALASNAFFRAVAGGLLPLAAPAMYRALTPQWAGTLLGFSQVLLIPVPFAFLKWGKQIRAKSPLLKYMQMEDEQDGAMKATVIGG